MKILTKGQLDRVRRLAMAADALVSQAETIVRNAHRSWHLRFHLKWAQDNLLSVISEPRFGSDYYDPPRTQKVERMERMERERKEKRMKHGRDSHGFPSADRKAGPPEISDGAVPSEGKHKETQ